MKILIAGWFSFEQMGATAGDLLARDLVCEWIQQAGIIFDIALAPPFEGGVNWQLIDPGEYSFDLPHKKPGHGPHMMTMIKGLHPSPLSILFHAPGP